ncbi:hypothetical protein DmAi_29670 [Acetobacter persici]|uniref:Uncharacterized protein n=1 Tax=Acetobacter persici TaxID=1076596 RepID=A0A6V8IBB1_9PROT|nr:hypothetical protein DmAi_29670 [Acetobacter persici]
MKTHNATSTPAASACQPDAVRGNACQFTGIKGNEDGKHAAGLWPASLVRAEVSL